MADVMDCSFIPTEDLIAELCRRSSTVVVGTISLIEPTRMVLRYYGKHASALGLLTLLRRDLLQNFDECNQE